MKALEAHLQRQLESSQEFFWHRLRAHAVSTFLPKGQAFRILDIGAGAGMLGEFVRARFPLASYHFIEPIESLEKQLMVRFGADRNEKGAPDFWQFDRVVALDVLEHQADDRAFAKDVVAKMKPGSILILTVPALQSLWSHWDVALGHFRRYRKRDLTSAFAGLSVKWLEVSYLFPEMVPLGLVRKWKGRGSNRAPSEAEFPALARPVNQFLYAIGRFSFELRSLMPLGTSVFGALRVLEDARGAPIGRPVL